MSHFKKALGKDTYVFPYFKGNYYFYLPIFLVDTLAKEK